LSSADEPQEDQLPDEDVSDAIDQAKAYWYVVHCYSGYENKVKKNLEHRAESMGMQTHILEVIVPTEEQVELRDGQRRVVERRIYPGYVLVEMILDEESWYVVRNTPGVTGFVGIGNKPTPLRQEEVDRIMKRMEAEEPVAQVKVKTGDTVRIVEGSFQDFNGTVDEVYPDKGKARVLVSFFNRETPIEVDLLQIERL
jgi:transcriptional antiterminator NusG